MIRETDRGQDDGTGFNTIRRSLENRIDRDVIESVAGDSVLLLFVCGNRPAAIRCPVLHCADGFDFLFCDAAMAAAARHKNRQNCVPGTVKRPELFKLAQTIVNRVLCTIP